MDNSYGLLKIHETNLRMLKEIDRICLKHNIRYMLDAGTLIGALREGGFIPWDDDVDIAMRREDWERFRLVADEELPEVMHLQTPMELADDGVFYDFTPRVIYKKSQWHAPDEESAYFNEKNNHLWIDIFITDNIPDSRLKDKMMRARQWLVYAFAMGYRYKLDYAKYSTIHKIGAFTLSHVGRLFDMRILVSVQDKWAAKYRNAPARHVFYANYQPDYLYVTLDREWVEDTERVDFEDTQLSVPIGAEAELKEVYGDWTRRPPEEKRVPPHGTEDIKVYG